MAKGAKVCEGRSTAGFPRIPDTQHCARPDVCDSDVARVKSALCHLPHQQQAATYTV